MRKEEIYEEITVLLRGSEWTQWVAYLKRQHSALQNEVNQHVDGGNIESARIAKALMDDRKKMIRSFIKYHNQIGDDLKGEQDE